MRELTVGRSLNGAKPRRTAWRNASCIHSTGRVPCAIATGDGAFAESWTAVWSYSPAGSGPLSLQTSIQVDPEDLTGSFIPAAPPGSCVRDVVVSIHLRADYFGGDILHHIVTACASAPTTGVSDVWDGTWASE